MRLRSIKVRNSDDGNEEEVQPQPDEIQKHQPPRKITKKVMGQIRDYYYLKTVKSLEELDKFRFKNFCKYKNISKREAKVSKSFTISCAGNRKRKKCKFELRAVRPDLASETIHIYAHSAHNHFIQSEETRARSRGVKELMQHANPPPTLRTSDKIEWKFLQTIPDYDKMNQFRHKNQCESRSSPMPTTSAWWRTRFHCTRKYYKNNCQFMLLAMKTTKQGYHVYKHGKHNHHATRLRKPPKRQGQQESHTQPQEQMENEDEEEEERVEEEDEEGDVEEDEDEDEEEEEDDDNEENDQELEPQQQPRKMTQISMGQKREYHFLKTVKSIEELDKFRHKNFCQHSNIYKRALTKKAFNSLNLPCKRKMLGKGCEFELRAERPSLASGDIHVYAHSKHNHPIKSAVNRLANQNAKQLMPDSNPPSIFRTPDSIEWHFLQTFTDYEQLQIFRLKNQCHSNSCGNKKRWRIRFVCARKYKNKCQFMLLALKTTKQGYHVYKHGKHNHHPIKPNFTKRKQLVKSQEKLARLNYTSRMKEEEESDDDDDDDEEEEENLEKDELPFKEEKQEDESFEQEECEDKEEGQEEEDDEEEEEDEDEEEQEEEGVEEEDDKERGEGPMKMEIKEENKFENRMTAVETLEEKLTKANEKVYTWMAGIEPTEIGATIGDWDKFSLLKMVEMADMEIREQPEKLNLWLPWLKCAIPKCLPQIEGFNVRFKDLIKLAFN